MRLYERRQDCYHSTWMWEEGIGASHLHKEILERSTGVIDGASFNDPFAIDRRVALEKGIENIH